MRTAPTAADLDRFLALLDGERWEELADMLADDVELADELTATWLRGRDAVAAYLRASTGVVTAIASTASDVASRVIGDATDLHTFELRQRYRLDGQERRERFTGCAIFRHGDGRARLVLLQLGQAGTTTRADEVTVEPGAGPARSVGTSVRQAREAAGLSLRALGEAAGLSASYLSQVERSRAELSVAGLTRIASAVGMPVAELLGDDAGGTVAVGRSTLRLPELGLTVQVAHAPAGARLEAGVIELLPDAPAHEPHDLTGERFVYVLDGVLAVLGPRATLVRSGEGVHLRGGAHRLAAHGRRPVRFLSTHLPGDASR
jgi:transcriptional regulator with XRE-family HTH domain